MRGRQSKDCKGSQPTGADRRHWLDQTAKTPKAAASKLGGREQIVAGPAWPPLAAAWPALAEMIAKCQSFSLKAVG